MQFFHAQRSEARRKDNAEAQRTQRFAEVRETQEHRDVANNSQLIAEREENDSSVTSKKRREEADS